MNDQKTTILSRIRDTMSALAQPLSDPFDESLDLASPEAPSGRQTAHDQQFCELILQGAGRSDQAVARAWRKLEQAMALVPTGPAMMSPLIPANRGALDEFNQNIHVDAFYVDRYTITNEQYAQFVNDGGYDREEFWATDTLPHLLQFVDQSGVPGPKYWISGRPPAEKRQHPVVGISWYEARAFCTWAGRRLPTAAQWQRAGSWFSTSDGPLGASYPWGNAFNPEHANTWHSEIGGTAAVDAFRGGATPNGVFQLVGNVWEWTAGAFGVSAEQGGSRLVLDQPMAEVRGGAFDTYFETQATCQFRTGQRLLHRGPNVGFRCSIGVNELPPQPDPSAFLLEPPV